MSGAEPAAKAESGIYCYGRRFGLIFLLLQGWWFALVPGSGQMYDWSSRLWQPVVAATGRALHLPQPVVLVPSGSSDKLFDYVQLLDVLALAALGAAAWLTVERRRRHEQVYGGLLRLFLRYEVAALMLSYGIAKVLEIQFPAPQGARLVEPFGAASPMGLLWTFMGFSRPYKVFLGVAEMGGGLLLLFRRTTPLGALVVAGIMTNVFMLNLCFDVPVKLGSGQILVMALLVLGPDLRRLAHVLVLNRPAAAVVLDREWPRRWMRWAAAGLKVALVGWILYANALDEVVEALQPEVHWAVEGLYRVETMVRGGQVEAPDLSNGGRWRYVAIDSQLARVVIRHIDDSAERFGAKVDAARQKVTLTPSGGPPIEVSYERRADGGMSWTGVFGGQPVTARLVPVDLHTFLLRNRGFHWISETNFNR
jgi:uncharacterized membrane protein YphA (DoxX/SURF4 family)